MLYTVCISYMISWLGSILAVSLPLGLTALYKARQGKIRPVAQISPFGSFVSLVNLAGVATPDPPLTGARRRSCGAAAPKNFINSPSPGDCIFAICSGIFYAQLHYCHIFGLTAVFSVY